MRILSLTVALASVVLPGRAPQRDRQTAPAPTRLAVVSGFEIPESAHFDADRDRYYVSNVNGHATRLDNNGFISLLSSDGRVLERRFIAGGRGGVTLHAPKGMAIRGRELWVADVTVVRRFDRITGEPGPVVDLAPHGAIFLNDIASAPDGGFYVSDTSFVFGADGTVARGGTDRVYRIDPAGAVTSAVADPRLDGPNGVFWDTRADRLLIASIGGRHLFGWTAATGLEIVATGPGGYDGIDALADGTILVSSQNLPGIVALDGTSLHPLIAGVSDTGDIGIDRARRRIAIPRLDANVVELWQLAP